jgi:hypothetical protein
MPFSVTSYMLGLSSIDLCSYTIGTLASLPALCGYVFIGTLADTRLSARMTSEDPLHWILLGIGGAATLMLTVRFGYILRRLGVRSRTVTTVGDQAGGVMIGYGDPAQPSLTSFLPQAIFYTTHMSAEPQEGALWNEPIVARTFGSLSFHIQRS